MSIYKTPNPYRRRIWISKIFPSTPKKENFGLSNKSIPDSFVYIKDATNEWGKHNIDNWNGEELTARKFSDPPDQPWTWGQVHSNEQEICDLLPEFFIFNEADEIQPVSEKEAKDWWELKRPQLEQEWQAEMAAYERYIKCRETFRVYLSEEKFQAFLIDLEGQVFALKTSLWVRKDAEKYIDEGAATLPFGHAAQLIEKFGYFYLYKDFLNVLEQRALKQSHLMSNIDLNRYPYLKFLQEAVQNAPFETEGRTSKKVIEAWLRDNWPDYLGKPSDSKIRYLATFLRRPEDEGGGVHAKAPDL